MDALFIIKPLYSNRECIMYKKNIILTSGHCHGPSKYHINILVTVMFLLGIFLAGITHFLALGRRLSVEQLVIHTRCLYAAYLSHCILRRTSQSLLDNNGVQSLLRASLARAGVGRRKA